MNAADLQTYYTRIGWDGAALAPFDRLRTLIAHHIAHIPFEAVDVLLGRAIDLDPATLFDKLVHRRRGGYCFEQNSLFRRILRAQGFDAEALIGRVLWMLPPGDPPRAWTHMALRVRIDDADHLVDVGFGSCVPPRPLRFDTTEPQETAHETFRLTPTAEGHLLEALIDDEWARVYEVARGAVDDDRLGAANKSVWSDASAHFRHRLMIAKTTPEARHVLLGNRLTVREPGRPPERTFLASDALRAMLENRFGLSDGIDWPTLIDRIDFQAETAAG